MDTVHTLTYLKQNSNIMCWLEWKGQELVSTYFQNQKSTFEVGDIILGKVKKIMPSIHGVFVEISPQIQGYLSFPSTMSLPKQEEEILVQISKEAHHNKNIALTSEIKLVGKYLILTTQSGMLRFSKKLSKIKKEELKEFINVQNFLSKWGIVFRTEASKASFNSIFEEIHTLSQKLEQIIESTNFRTCYSLLYRDTVYLNQLRDRQIEVLTNHLGLYNYLVKEDIPSKLYENNGKELPLEAIFPINTKLDRLLSSKVWLKSGSYLMIEATEAFVSIDVNTGKNIQKRNKEKHFFEVNKEALIESFNQIRLRNLSGVILIDLIDMDEKKHQEEILMLSKDLAKLDSIGSEVVELTKLQFLTLTRKRMRPSLVELLQS